MADSFVPLNKVVEIKLKKRRKNQNVDSVIISIDNKKVLKIDNDIYQSKFSTKGLTVGKHQLKATGYNSGSICSEAYININILPSKPPVEYTYKVIKKYPHNNASYTQGLTFYKGKLYESTGQQGKSKLMEIDLESGKAIREIKLADIYFGEGITFVGDKIYQVTYHANRGFVYDSKTFKKIKEFKYKYAEGWGMTNIGDTILLTTGSEKLYFIDSKSEEFHHFKEISVADDKGKAVYLNELENVKGKIYANVYTEDYIIIIDPKTGEIEGKIDFTGLLSKEDQGKIEPDVLNGIAYNPETNKLYVTGKNWSKLYEVEIVKK